MVKIRSSQTVLWERVQAFIAVSVTVAILYVAVRVPTDKEQHVRLSSAFFLIIGYYFGRSRERADRDRDRDDPEPR